MQRFEGMSGAGDRDEEKKPSKRSFTRSFKDKIGQLTGSLLPAEMRSANTRTEERPPPNDPRRSPADEEVVNMMKRVYSLAKGPCTNYCKPISILGGVTHQNEAHTAGNCQNNPKCLKGLGESEDRKSVV